MADAPAPTLLQSTIPGPPGIQWMNAWDPTLLYVERNAVREGGSAWYALVQNSGIRPSTDNGTNWSLIVGFSPQSGTTSGRPVATTTGRMFFDTTLGKPIWWFVDHWIDATGATV